MKKLTVFILALALSVVLAQRSVRGFRAGAAGCNPPCDNGGSCIKVGSRFKCRCLLGLYGVTCNKIVNFCVTASDGVKKVEKPCSSDPLVSSCAPTIGPIHTQQNILGEGTGLVTLAAYACLQNDQTGTCQVSNDATGIFAYTCTTNDQTSYVYGY